MSRSASPGVRQGAELPLFDEATKVGAPAVLTNVLNAPASTWMESSDDPRQRADQPLPLTCSCGERACQAEYAGSIPVIGSTSFDRDAGHKPLRNRLPGAALGSAFRVDRYPRAP